MAVFFNVSVCVCINKHSSYKNGLYVWKTFVVCMKMVRTTPKTNTNEHSEILTLGKLMLSAVTLPLPHANMSITEKNLMFAFHSCYFAFHSCYFQFLWLTRLHCCHLLDIVESTMLCATKSKKKIGFINISSVPLQRNVRKLV